MMLLSKGPASSDHTTDWTPIMGLRLTGTLYKREGKAYTLDNGQTGTSYTATVDMGRGDVLRVKVPADPDLLAQIPPTSEIPEKGLEVEYELGFGFGKLRVTKVHKSGMEARSLRPAAAQ